MNSDDLGKVFRKDDGTFWVMVSYLSEPGVSFRRIDTGEKTIMVGANSLIANSYSPVSLPNELTEFLNKMSYRNMDKRTPEPDPVPSD